MTRVVASPRMIDAARRAALIPCRLVTALKYHTPALGLIARWLFSSREHTNFRFLFYRAEPDRHWYPGAGIGFSCPDA